MDTTSKLKIDKNDFTPEGPDGFVRVDHRCKELVLHFYRNLVAGGMPATDATLLANGADYFVRDFVVDQLGRNIFDEEPGVVRQFAGNWYIVTTVEPRIDQLAEQLGGIKAFYRFLREQGLISAGFLAEVSKECDDLPYYERRIETFWEIAGDGYLAWDRECPVLK